MALKLFRTVWFLSVLVVLADLLYVYASLPELVTIAETDPISVSREWLFYILVALIAGINLLVYLFKILYQEEEGENVRSWFHGLIITINIFIVISMHALNVYNSTEMFDDSRIIFFLWGGLGFILLWAALWPLYMLFRKYSIKESV